MKQIFSGKFNIRVYGILLNDKHEVLLSNEFQQNIQITKFPGGGLEYGEGTITCLKREMQEECNQEIECIKHFYTTDFFQKALFFENTQLISIYYKAKIKDSIKFKTNNQPFASKPMKNGDQSFCWKTIESLNPSDFTFPIDQHVAFLLKQS